MNLARKEKTESKLRQNLVKQELTFGTHDHRLEFNNNEVFVWFLHQYSHSVPLFIDK